MKIKIHLLSFILFICLFGLGSLFPKMAFAANFILSGSVKDSAGNAISGTTVSVNDANNDSTTVDSTGNYSLTIPSGTYNVQITPPSGSGFTSAIAVNQNITTNTILNFVLVPTGTVTLSGRVLDAVGQPLANQTVSIAPSGTNNFINSVTDANGNYNFQVASGNYLIKVSGTNPLTASAPPSYSIQSNGTLPLIQNTVMDIPIPANKVVVHVQDVNGVAQQNVGLSTNSPALVSSPIGTVTNTQSTASYNSSLGLTTDSSGNATLWLFSTSGTANRYTITATPPSGSNFNPFALNSVAVTGNQTELISLQYNHPTPVTTAMFSPTPFSDGAYPDPTTVTLSASAAAGYTVAN